MNDASTPASLPAFKEEILNGHKFTIGRLTVTAATDLFYELAQGLIPVLGDLAERQQAKKAGGLLDGILKLDGLGPMLERLVKHLTPEKFRSLAKQVLASTTVNGKPVIGQVDAVMGSSLNYQKLVYTALVFQFSDFADALGGFQETFRGLISEESNTLSPSPQSTAS